MSKKFLIPMMVLVNSILLSFTSYAGLITDQLYDTGLDSDGNPLANLNGSEDGHWLVRLASEDSSNNSHAITFKHRAYSSEGGDSKWISVDSNGGNSTTNLTAYLFSTSFDLTGYDSSTAMITGLWGIDNYGAIWLNDNDTGNSLSYGFPAFKEMHEFSISDFFIDGVNTLTVELTNGYDNNAGRDPGPMAIRFDNLQLTANPVPAPKALLFFALLLLLLAANRIRLTQAK
jgi:hypothetical protein